MRKIVSVFILFALSLSLCAQNFDKQKVKQIAKQGIAKVKQYVISVDNVAPGYYSWVKLCAKLQKQFAGKNPTLAQIEAFAKKQNNTQTQFQNGIVFYAYYKHDLTLLKQICTKQQTDYSYEYLSKLLKSQGKYKQLIALKEVDTYSFIKDKFDVYYLLRDRANTWKYGKKLFEDFYVSNANAATDILTKMFNRRPVDLKDTQVAQFLKYIADKYPTPGSDFETWRSFMGFVGFRYKSATGKDLFTK